MEGGEEVQTWPVSGPPGPTALPLGPLLCCLALKDTCLGGRVVSLAPQFGGNIVP